MIYILTIAVLSSIVNIVTTIVWTCKKSLSLSPKLHGGKYIRMCQTPNCFSEEVDYRCPNIKHTK